MKLLPWIEKLRHLSKTALLKDASWMMVSQVLGALIQTVYFIFIAQRLGSEDYGIFEGVKAIGAIIYPFIGVGLSNILVLNVARDKSTFSKYWGESLLFVLLSLLIVLIIVFPLSVFLLPSIPPTFILLIFLAELLGLKLCDLAANVFISINQAKFAAFSNLFYLTSKIIFSLFLLFYSRENQLIIWGVLYFLGSITPGILLAILINIKIGKPKFNPKTFKLSDLKEGFYFSVGTSASNINSQIDRTMLVSMSTPVASGIYSAGYRFIDLGFKPLAAIAAVSYPKFFKHGESGIGGSLRYARKLLPFIIGYGILSLVGLVLFSPFVSYVLGDDFSESSQVLLWFAPIHLIGGIGFLVADALTGAGYQKIRSAIQVTAAVINVTMNLLLIPIYSWRGAAWATLGSELFKVFAYSVAAYLCLYYETKKSSKDIQ